MLGVQDEQELDRMLRLTSQTLLMYRFCIGLPPTVTETSP